MLSLVGERPPPLHPTPHPPKKFWIITCTTIWVCCHYYGFCFWLILEYPDHHQNVISSSLYYPRPFHKISSKLVHNFLSNVVHRQTNRQTDKPTLPKHNITSFAKEVTSLQLKIRDSIQILQLVLWQRLRD